MAEISTDLRTRQQPAGLPSALSPLPPAALLRRRRFVRYGAALTFIFGVGLSCIPGPKGSSHRVVRETDGGVTTQVLQFSYYRPYGLPFVIARAEYGDDGEIRRVTAGGASAAGLLGNIAVAFALVATGFTLIGRRRKN